MINLLKTKLKDCSHHYEIFLVLYMILNVIAVGFTLKLVFEVVTIAPSFDSYFSVSFVWMVLSALILCAVQGAAAYWAQRFTKEGNVLGFIILFILSTFCLFSIMFPLGFFGFYAITNAKFRNSYFIKERPLWLESIYEQVERWTSPKKAADPLV